MHAEFSLAFDFLAVVGEVDAAGNFERPRAGHDSLIIIDVLDCSKSISGRFLDHRNGVFVGTLDEDGA